MTRPQGFMDYSLFQKIIDEIIEIDSPIVRKEGIWLHHFGESLLHPEFDKMVSYCSSRGLKVGLSVNPIMLNEEISSRLIQAKPSVLYLALDGHDDESFYKIRGVPNAFVKSKDNAVSFIKSAVENKSGIKISICMIDFAENTESIAEMKSFWKRQKGVSDVFIKPFTEWNGDVTQIQNMHAAQATSETKYKERNQNEKIRVKCPFPWKNISITWDGNVVPCCNDYNDKYVLGNARNNSLMEIWNGDRMQSLRREFLSGKISNSLCANCRYAKG
jgi:radical SAM protein with 4Fe4S-binding SPASM domain